MTFPFFGIKHKCIHLVLVRESYKVVTSKLVPILVRVCENITSYGITVRFLDKLLVVVNILWPISCAHRWEGLPVLKFDYTCLGSVWPDSARHVTIILNAVRNTDGILCTVVVARNM